VWGCVVVVVVVCAVLAARAVPVAAADGGLCM
jgi:hypothetical protein